MNWYIDSTDAEAEDSDWMEYFPIDRYGYEPDPDGREPFAEMARAVAGMAWLADEYDKELADYGWAAVANALALSCYDLDDMVDRDGVLTLPEAMVDKAVEAIFPYMDHPTDDDCTAIWHNEEEGTYSIQVGEALRWHHDNCRVAGACSNEDGTICVFVDLVIEGEAEPCSSDVVLAPDPNGDSLFGWQVVDHFFSVG